jgi:hypothetical protein
MRILLVEDDPLLALGVSTPANTKKHALRLGL